MLGLQCKSEANTQNSSTRAYSSFLLSGKIFNLSTSCSVQVRSESQHMIPQVITYPCEVLNQQLKKCLQISFKGTVVIVQDRITFGSIIRNVQNCDKNSVQNLSHSRIRNNIRSGKKMVLFKNSSNNISQVKGNSNKKNIVKNITNAFLKCLKDKDSEDSATKGIITAVEGLVQTLKYNNQLITAIIKHQTARQYFKLFLATHAGEWIQNSKVKSKHVYSKAIKLYQQLILDKEKESQGQNKQSTPVSSDSNRENSLCLRELQNYDLQEEMRGFK